MLAYIYKMKLSQTCIKGLAKSFYEYCLLNFNIKNVLKQRGLLKGTTLNNETQLLQIQKP